MQDGIERKVGGPNAVASAALPVTRYVLHNNYEMLYRLHNQHARKKYQFLKIKPEFNSWLQATSFVELRSKGRQTFLYLTAEYEKIINLRP